MFSTNEMLRKVEKEETASTTKVVRRFSDRFSLQNFLCRLVTC
jgi:hypothetical protein